MLREVPLFGALAPSPLLYFLAAIPIFLALDWPLRRLGVYRLLWHPPLARFSLFICLLYALGQLAWF